MTITRRSPGRWQVTCTQYSVQYSTVLYSTDLAAQHGRQPRRAAGLDHETAAVGGEGGGHQLLLRHRHHAVAVRRYVPGGQLAMEMETHWWRVITRVT